MSSFESVLATVQAAAGGALVSSLLVLSISVIVFSVFAFGVSGASYVALLAWSTFERTAQPATNKSQLSSNKRELTYGFNETALVAVLGVQLAALWSSLGAFGSLIFGGSSTLGRFVVSNLPLILSLLVVFPVVVIWDTWHEVFLESFGEIYNCFVAPIVRPLFLPIVNVYALFFGSVLPVSNSVREILNGVTTTAFVRVLACAGGAIQALALQLVAVGTAFAAALTAWFQIGDLQQFYVAPDFHQTGLEIGKFLGDTQLFADCACQPVSQVVFTPLFDPLRSDDFAEAVNQTINTFVVAGTQGVLRPIVVSFTNAAATPGAPFDAIFSRPSFNSTFDTGTAAVLSIGTVADLYLVALYRILVNTVAAFLTACPAIPGWSNTAPCRNGVVDGLCDALNCLVPSVVPIGCCRSSLGFCAANQTEASCGAPGSTFRLGSCMDMQPECESGAFPGCCAQNTFISGNTFSPMCNDDVLDTTCAGPTDVFYIGQTCTDVLDGDPSLICLARTSGVLIQTEDRACGGCADNGEVCRCSECLCEYQTDTLFGVNSCAAGKDPATCELKVDDLTAPLVPSFFTGIAGLGDATFIQPLRIVFHALWNVDVVFTTFDGYIFFDIEPVVDAAHTGIDYLTTGFEWFALWLEDLGDLAAEALSAPPSESLAVRSTPGITPLELQQIDALASEGELIRDAIDIVVAYVRFPRAFLIALVDAVFEGTQLMINLIVGSAWLTVDTGVNGVFPNPFAYAQLIWGDNIAQSTGFDCVATRPNTASIKLFGATVNNLAGSEPCNIEMAILNHCRFVFNKALAQTDTSPGAENDARTNPPAFLNVNALSSTTTLRSTVVACVGNSERCRAAVVPGTVIVPVPANVFEDNLNNVVAIFGAFDPLVGSICDQCVGLQGIFSGLAEPFVRLLLVPIDVVVHLDLLLVTSYVKCIDLISAAEAVQDFFATATDLLREVQFGISGTQCTTGVTARDSRIFCVLAQAVDAIVNVASTAFSILWNLAQAIVGLIDGSITDTKVLTNQITIARLEPPIRSLAFDIVAVFIQIIPDALACSAPGCCVLTTNPSVPQPCTAQVFFSECSGGVFYAGQMCRTPVLGGGVFAPANTPAMFSQSCGIPFNFGTGCCRTRNADPFSGVNVARICRDDLLADNCDNTDHVFNAGALCSSFDFSALRCPVKTGAKDVAADAFGIILADLGLLIPRVTVGVVRTIADILLSFNTDDPFSDLIEAYFQPFFIVLGNGLDQIARIIYCAGSSVTANALNEIGSAVTDILDTGLQLLTKAVLLTFYLVVGTIQLITTNRTTVLEQAGQLLLDTVIFLAFAIFGDEAVCGLQDFLCDVCFFSGCDASVDFAVNQCRAFACCNGNLALPSDICNQPDDDDDPPTCDCTGITNPITMCTDPRVACGNSKRSAPMKNPFAAIVAEDLARVKSKRSSVLSGEFCGSYLAAYGYDKARAERDDGHNSTAAQCIDVSTHSLHDEAFALMDEYVLGKVMRVRTQTSRLLVAAQAHWASMHEEAADEARFRAAALNGTARGQRSGYGLYKMLEAATGHRANHPSKRSAEEHDEFRTHVSALFRQQGGLAVRNMVVHALASWTHLRDHWVSPVPHYLTTGTAEQRKRSAPSDGVNRMQLGLRIIYYRMGLYKRQLSDALGRAIGDMVLKVQPQTPPTSPASLVQPLLINNDTLDLINLPPCNVSEQGVCTGCLVLDDAIRVTQRSANGLIDFYPDNETGYLSYVDRFVDGIETTLIDPFGTDNFTTVPKRVPWIGERLATVRWFWQWNYTQFLSIIENNSTTIPANQTAVLQAQRAAAAGREDYDNFFFAQFRAVIAPLVRIGESLVGVGINTGQGSDALSQLFITYLLCDYQGALQCRSADLGVGLFDGIVNVLLIYLIIGTVFISINVLVGFSAFVLLVPFAYNLTMWIAYGASPLCTTPSLILGIPGVPTCLPADIYTLTAETLQQCPVVPISLIRPEELATASETLCTACGAVPSMVNCAEFGFLNGLDVFFYSAPSIFGDTFNARAASALAGTAPDVAVVAELYTPEYIAGLGEAGRVCNRIMIPSLYTAAGIVAARVALVGALFISLALLAAAAFWLVWTVLLWLNEIVRQVDEGFVQQTRVEKLRLD